MSLGAPTGTDVEALKAENEHLKLKVEALEKELSEAKAQLTVAAPPVVPCVGPLAVRIYFVRHL